MRDFASNTAVVSACGFGLSKAATSIGYLSAMGSVVRNIGFVTELWFMLASEAVSLALAIVVASLAARGRLRPHSIPQWQALLVFFAGFLLNASGVLAPVPDSYSAALLGCLYGVASFLFCVTWMEEFVYQNPSESHKSMVAGLCIQTVLVAVASMLPGGALVFIAMASAFVSVLCHFSIVMRKTGALGEDARPERPSEREALDSVTARAFVAKFGTAFACLFVLVGVVGILHTSVLGSSFEHIVGGVSMWIPLAFATVVTAVAGLAALRLPDPTSVYKAVLPVILALLTLLPFVGDYLGPLAGGVMIACYDVCGMLFLFYIVDAAHGHRQQSYLLSSVYMGGSNGFLALGLGIGLLVNYLSGDYGISLMTLFAFVAMYPLGIAFVMVMRRSMRGTLRDGDEDASQNPDQEPDWEAALRSFAARYGLTKRETEICSYLVRGRSAKHIAEELFISENTVWTHTKNVYAKTKVSGKDDLMNLFEDEALDSRARDARKDVPPGR